MLTLFENAFKKKPPKVQAGARYTRSVESIDRSAMAVLPEALFHEICKMLDDQSLCELATTGRWFRRESSLPILWRSRLAARFPEAAASPLDGLQNGRLRALGAFSMPHSDPKRVFMDLLQRPLQEWRRNYEHELQQHRRSKCSYWMQIGELLCPLVATVLVLLTVVLVQQSLLSTYTIRRALLPLRCLTTSVSAPLQSGRFRALLPALRVGAESGWLLLRCPLANAVLRRCGATQPQCALSPSICPP